MSVPYRITVRISEETMEKLTELVDTYRYESVSDLIRKAIEDLVDRHYAKDTMNPDIKISRDTLRSLENEIDTNPSLSLDDVLKIVIREYTYRKMNNEIEKIASTASKARKKRKDTKQ